MDIENLLDFYNEVNKLKTTIRYKGTDNVFKESTADHSWRLALMCMDLYERYNVDIEIMYAVKLALVHDLCEYNQNNDFTVSDVLNGRVSKEQKNKLELEAMNDIAKKYNRNDIFEMWKDYENHNSKEAKYIKLLDRMEAILHIIDKLDAGKFISDLGYIAIYCDELVKKFPELIPVLKGIKDKLKRKFLKAGIEWKAEYDVHYTEN